MFYTTNGTTPTTKSTRYSSAITVSSSETIEAIDSASGYSTSPVSSAAYTITSVPATPSFSPAAGAYHSAQLVTISGSSLNATIYYTVTSDTTGTAPTTSSTVYTGAISVSSTETLEAIAAVTGYTSSSAATATYTLPAIAPSTTALAMASGGNSVTSIASGSAVTLTATVASGATKVTTGTVNFCDATATYCTDIHLLGTAQLTNSGTATINLRPNIGSHSYKAIFVGISGYVTSTSSTAQLTVTGSYPTATTILWGSGSAGNYSLTAQVMGLGNNTIAPTGTVSILDTSSSNAVLGKAPLTGSGTALTLANVSTIPFPITQDDDSNVVAVGDFNGDGRPDIAVLGVYSVTILLSNGDGTFTQAVNSPVTLSNDPGYIAVGDFNGDGKIDLAILSPWNTATILLGNGDGTFTQANGSPINLGLGMYPTAVAVGDFNRDGKLDLAVTSSSDAVTILLGNGDGTFTVAGNSPAVGGDADFVVVGDFNGDGIPDLAVTNYDGAVTILLGNGDGTFTQANGSPIYVGYENNSVAVGDFNGDGKLDLAVTCFYYPNVFILLGNGDGTFAIGTNAYVGNGPYSVAVSDFNKDGIPDLAVTNNYSNTVTILLGKDDGTFLSNNTVSLSTDSPDNGDEFNFNGPESTAVADFNGDGVPDLAVVSFNNIAYPSSSTVTILQTNVGETSTATITGIAPAGIGTHNVDASYGGDSNFTGSTSATTPLTTVVDAANAVSPSSGPAGTLVMISGMDFGATQGTSSVTVGGITAVAAAWSNTQIQAYIPSGTGPGPQSVVVTVGGLPGGGAATYTVTPSIATISPSTGFPNSSVTIVGTNFGSYVGGSSSVTFNGISAQVTNWTSSTINVSLPNGVTTGPVVVTAYASNGSLIVSNDVVFTMLTNPTITGLSPVAGTVGTNVTISGGNFGASGTVTFNGVSASPTSWGIGTIIVPVPVGATTGPVVVTAGGVTSNGYIFSLRQGITSVTPASVALYGGQVQQFSASVFNTSNQAVTWTISPSGTGTISAAGLYTAPASVASLETVTVTATSQAGTAQSASAMITLSPPQCASSGYSYQRSIVIDHTKVPNTDQVDFPFLFNTTAPSLATIANSGHVSSPSGYDIIFSTDPAGLTKLDHELEQYNPVTGQVIAWVRIPTLSHTTDTVLYVFYGNSSVTTSQQNPTGVWDSNYAAVYHLANVGTSTAADSTANGNTATLASVATASYASGQPHG
jgi:hypothetical protein